MHAIIQAIFRAPITLMVAKVYVPVLFPLTFLIALTAIKIDSLLGFPTMFEYPTNWIVSIFSFILGFVLWIWTYEQLTRLGEGSPSPTAGRTIKLVRTGIYAHSRKPFYFWKALWSHCRWVCTQLNIFCFYSCSSSFNRLTDREGLAPRTTIS